MTLKGEEEIEHYVPIQMKFKSIVIRKLNLTGWMTIKEDNKEKALFLAIRQTFFLVVMCNEMYIVF